MFAKIQEFEKRIKMERENIEIKFEATKRMIKKKQIHKQTKVCTNQLNYNKDLFFISDNDYTGISQQIDKG